MLDIAGRPSGSTRASILFVKKKEDQPGFPVHSRELGESTTLLDKYTFAVSVGGVGQARLGDGRIQLNSIDLVTVGNLLETW